MAYLSEAMEFSGIFLAFQAPLWATTEFGFFATAALVITTSASTKRILLNKQNFIVD
jgi:uncharacterized protein YukJ